jgi:hypothetical protein
VLDCQSIPNILARSTTSKATVGGSRGSPKLLISLHSETCRTQLYSNRLSTVFNGRRISSAVRQTKSIELKRDSVLRMSSRSDKETESEWAYQVYKPGQDHRRLVRHLQEAQQANKEHRCRPANGRLHHVAYSSIS